MLIQMCLNACARACLCACVHAWAEWCGVVCPWWPLTFEVPTRLAGSSQHHCSCGPAPQPPDPLCVPLYRAVCTARRFFVYNSLNESLTQYTYP